MVVQETGWGTHVVPQSYGWFDAEWLDLKRLASDGLGYRRHIALEVQNTYLTHGEAHRSRGAGKAGETPTTLAPSMLAAGDNGILLGRDGLAPPSPHRVACVARTGITR